jgi:hypothetical protein
MNITSNSNVFSHNSTVPHDSNDYIRSECSKRYNNLSIESIEKVVLSKCKSTHDIFKCDGCCSYKFVNPQVAIESISKLRQKIWNNNFTSVISSRYKGRDARNSIILGELLSHRYKDDNDIYQLQYIINGVRVCRNFYFKSTGLSKKIFNSVTNYLTNKNCTKKDDYFDRLFQTPALASFHADIESIVKNRPSKRPKLNDTSLKDNVLVFLDIQFANGVDFAPENNHDRYTHLSWNELYRVYKSYCNQLFISAAEYTFFCKIRSFDIY